MNIGIQICINIIYIIQYIIYTCLILYTYSLCFALGFLKAVVAYAIKLDLDVARL